MSGELVVIGLDGVRLDVVQRFHDQLPTLGGFLDSGAYGRLESVLPGPHSGPAWTSFSTGLNPGKHGLGDWRIRDGYTFRPASGEDVPYPRFWDYASDGGHTSGVFNIPLTNPPQPLDGVLVTSWTSSLDTYTYPASFREVLADVGYQRKADFSSPDDPLENLFTSIEARRRGFEAFMDRYDWDLFVGMFYETEQAHHQFATMVRPDHPLHEPDHERKVRLVYEKIDAELDRLFDRLDDATVFVLSDHGFCPLFERVYLNRILEAYGYYAPPTEDEKTRGTDRLLAGAIRRLKTSDTIRAAAKRAVDVPVVGSVVEAAIDEYRGIEYQKTISADWSRTKAFNGYEHGGIFLNTTDAPEGIVPREGADGLVDAIISDLRNDEFLADRVDGIYRREQLFEGERLHALPEIIVDFADGYLGSSGYHHDRAKGPSYFESEGKYVGFHTMEGLFLADGPDVQAGPVEDLSLLDVAPTVLHFLGEPVPENIDGQPRSAVFEQDSEFATRDVETQAPLERSTRTTLSDAEREQVESRLREMGYK
jgi:predicted AlkP superfamily phosphohydrolase/phosphomutase